MHEEGSVTIRAPRQRVWAFLTDPEAVASCAPGIESVEVVEPSRRFRVVAAAGFGIVKARFHLLVEWLDLEPPARATMAFHGEGSGSALDGRTSMELAELSDGTTRLDWKADVSIAGAIASVAGRLASGVSAKLTREFFAAARERIEEREPARPN